MSRSKLSSIIQCKCPSCREGEMFKKPGLFVYTDMLGMHIDCENCGQHFEIEPGFWIGAMWISYPLVVIIELPFLFLALFAEGNMVWVYFGAMVFSFIVFWPLLLRMGRSSWAHICIREENK